jgi:serine/threonine protein kinase
LFFDDDPLFKRCGTPGFVAPEVLNYKTGGEFYNEKCDIFSAGAIFYMLVTGNSPFRGEDAAAILQKNKECEINFYVLAIEKVFSILIRLLQN